MFSRAASISPNAPPASLIAPPAPPPFFISAHFIQRVNHIINHQSIIYNFKLTPPAPLPRSPLLCIAALDNKEKKNEQNNKDFNEIKNFFAHLKEKVRVAISKRVD
jgi:hypothetical protein